MATETVEPVDIKSVSDQSVLVVMAREAETSDSFTPSSSSISLAPPPEYDTSHYETPENLAKVIKIQSLWRKASVLQHFELILKLHRKRTRVAREIWNSETTYLEGLMTMMQFFYNPLTKMANEPNTFVTIDQVTLLFGNLMQLIDQSKKMNTAFAKVITAYTPHSRLGHIFSDNAEQLKAAFTPYVDPFDDANALFLSLRKDNERFKEWLGGIEFKVCDLGLESYLIMPIQRITRYGLLLRELIHQTWQDHDDFESLQAALSAVEEVAQHVNGHKKKVIMQQKIKAIMSQIAGLPEIANEDSRLYITEGPVTDLGASIPVTHYIFLFSDVMIWTQMVNKKKFMFRKLNYLKDSTAEAAETATSFKVITHDWTTTVFTKTKEDQNKWLAYLENENFTPSATSPHPKRPEQIFLSKKKMVENALKRGLNRRNAGSSLRVKDPSKRGSKKSEIPENGRGSLRDKSSKRGSLTPDGKDKEKKPKDKDKTRKIPRGYATVDAKVLEKRDKERKSSKVKPTDSGSAAITPELLQALRATRDLTPEQRERLAAQLESDPNSALPPLLPSDLSSGNHPSSSRSSASSSSDSANDYTKKSENDNADASNRISSSISDNHNKQNSDSTLSQPQKQSSIKITTAKSNGEASSTASTSSGNPPISLNAGARGSGSLTAADFKRMGPPPMPDTSHVKAAAAARLDAASPQQSRIGSLEATSVKPRGKSFGASGYATVHVTSSRAHSTTISASPSVDESSQSAAGQDSPSKASNARPSRAPPIARVSTEFSTSKTSDTNPK